MILCVEGLIRTRNKRHTQAQMTLQAPAAHTLYWSRHAPAPTWTRQNMLHPMWRSTHENLDLSIGSKNVNFSAAIVHAGGGVSRALSREARGVARAEALVINVLPFVVDRTGPRPRAEVAAACPMSTRRSPCQGRRCPPPCCHRSRFSTTRRWSGRPDAARWQRRRCRCPTRCNTS
jgi:hypothetical protein